MDRQRLDAVADRLFAALEGDVIADLEASVTDDLKVWHNFDDTWLDRAGFLDGFRGAAAAMPNRKIGERRRLYDGDRVMQQHMATATPGEGAIRFAGCMILTIRDDRVAQIEEYVDLATLAPQA